MTFETDQRLRALPLMHLALELLDRAGEHKAAAHLQHAISIVEREPLPQARNDDQSLIVFGGSASHFR